MRIVMMEMITLEASTITVWLVTRAIMMMMMIIIMNKKINLNKEERKNKIYSRNQKL